MGAGQVQVIGRAISQVVVDLASVEFGHLAGRIDDREHDGAGEVLMTGGAVQSQALQLAADRRPFFPGLCG